MVRTKSMVYKESVESRELLLYTVNESLLYPWTCSIVRCLSRKYRKGTFDADRAIDAFYPLACDAAKRYCREFARVEDAPRVFTVTDRFTCAADMVDYYMEDIEKGDL